MKKIFFIVALSLVLVACSNDTNSDVTETKTEAVESVSETTVEEETIVEKETVTEENDDVLVKVEELPYEFTIDEEPDSSDSVYAHYTYTNNSKYPVVGFNLTIHLKDINEKTYASIYDTVMPNETSPSFETFAPKNSNKDDMEFLKLEYNVKNTDNGKEYLITYDYKLKNYDVLELVE